MSSFLDWAHPYFLKRIRFPELTAAELDEFDYYMLAAALAKAPPCVNRQILDVSHTGCSTDCMWSGNSEKQDEGSRRGIKSKVDVSIEKHLSRWREKIQKEKNETKKSATQRLKLQSRSKNRRSSKDNRRSILEVVYQGMTEAETIEDTAHICVPNKPKEKSPNRKPQQQSPNTPKGKMPKGSRKTWEWVERDRCDGVISFWKLTSNPRQKLRSG